MAWKNAEYFYRTEETMQVIRWTKGDKKRSHTFLYMYKEVAVQIITNLQGIHLRRVHIRLLQRYLFCAKISVYRAKNEIYVFGHQGGDLKLLHLIIEFLKYDQIWSQTLMTRRQKQGTISAPLIVSLNTFGLYYYQKQK